MSINAPPAPRAPEQARRLDRMIGALLGVHAGDTLGASLEFESYANIKKSHPDGLHDIIGGGPFGWAPGHATDDTDMTRAVLLAYRDQLLGKDSDLDVAKQAGLHFLNWLRGRWPDRRPGSFPLDIGGATRAGLMAFKKTLDPMKAGAGMGRSGNGSLMRCIPTALFQRDLDKMVDESVRISAITHNDPRCTIACAAYNRTAYGLVTGEDVRQAVNAGFDVATELEDRDAAIATEPEEGDAVDYVPSKRIRFVMDGKLTIVELVAEGPGCLYNRASGYVLDSLSIAIAAVLDPRPAADVLVDVVRIGYDTDTNAAIAGGLLGARDGAEALPGKWVEKLQFGQEFRAITTELFEKITTEETSS